MIVSIRNDTYAERDNRAVASFAEEMKRKLERGRFEGKSGWDEDEPGMGGCSTNQLRKMLRKHVEKGDPVDVANFAMFLWHRNESTVGEKK